MSIKIPSWAAVEDYKSGTGIRVKFNNGNLHLTFAQNEQLMVVASSGRIEVHRCENGAVCLAPAKEELKREVPEA